MDVKKTGTPEPFTRAVVSGQKLLRCGYTTGTAAALAAAGAAYWLLTGELPAVVRLTTPKGWPVEAALQEPRRGEGWASAGVVKQAGDDPDATDGICLFARVERCESLTAGEKPETGEGNPVVLEGGRGIGRVKKPGLDQPVGAAAINTVPRRMIAAAVREAAAKAGYRGALRVVITAPEGEARAAKTFNPLLGIEGGISVLGTSGIVEPMSEAALVESIRVELRQQRALGETRLLLTPGNYGLDYLARMGWKTPRAVRCSNYIGEAVDSAVALGFRELVLVGHIGKLCKLAAGIFNTHSRVADGRREVFVYHAALAGAHRRLLEDLAQAVTTEGCLELLGQAGLAEAVMERMLASASAQLERRAGEDCRAGLVLFSNERGTLGVSPNARELLAEWEGG